ncbi:hypothetical protein A0006_13595 [Listeria monocytogenes]|nr:hypothetical protein [Listeria monocytogenes]EAF8941956.1 hypothetical protein [Listeria monocytogenes]EAF8947962.1 hypothetical protein [Listeria monocytogenes]EAF8950566.1 hypothetical protein [Listeria monocytogenes]EAF8953673.1 hypothetical protein [Listeria monocytogenes]
MTKSILLDSCRMFEHACAFVDCAKYCEIEPNNIEYRMQSHTVSGIVNSAFACEVFIKSLLVFHGMTVEKLRGHNLKKLWDEFKAEDCETACLVEERMRGWFNSENENMFDELLDNVSDAFEYWRYIYEKQDGNINLNFLRGFRDLLREVCCNKLFGKSWNEYIKDVQ